MIEMPVMQKHEAPETVKKHKSLLSKILCDFKCRAFRARSCSLGMFSTKILPIMMQPAGRRGIPTDFKN